jgi:hypothetical protein
MGNGYKACQSFSQVYKLRHLLIMFRHTAIASFTMLASQRHSNHAGNAEILLVKLPQLQKFIDDSLLLREATEFGHKPRFVEHSAEVEIPAKTVEYPEGKVANGIC